MASDDIRYCADQGSLVGVRYYWLPTEPFDYDWGRSSPQIGCNHIRCSRCGQRVTIVPQEHNRRYYCRCYEETEDKQVSLGAPPDEYRGLRRWSSPPPHTWACAGHPAFQVPSVLDGVLIAPDHFREVARIGFASPPFMPPASSGRAIWVSRLYWILPAPLRDALGTAVSDLLLDDDPQVAAGAMSFYYEQRMAKGNERLTAIARDHGARLAKIAAPNVPGYTLEDQLLSALKFRGFRRDDTGQLVDPEAHELLRQALLAGKNPDEVIYTFGRLEPEWLAANAAEIVKSSPKLLRDVVYLLSDHHEVRQGAYRAIAALDPVVRDELYKRIDAVFKGEERAQILADLARDT